MRGKGEGSVFKDKRGYWTASVELPSSDGTRRRKVIRKKTKREALAALTDLTIELRKRGDLPTASDTVEQWFTYWYHEIAAKKVRPNTLAGYKSSVFNHIIPTIGRVRLDKVLPAHVRRVHDAIVDKGFSSTTALLAHRVMAVSFKAAERENRIGRNPAALTDAPRKAATPLEALTYDEAMQVLQYALTDTAMGARWAIALLTGARRGEVLGLELDRVGDFLDLSWQLQRIPLTDTEGRPDVPADYKYRHLVGGLYLTSPKAHGGRGVPLVQPLRGFIERHIANMPANEYGLLFTQNGRPIGPDVDSMNWRKMLQAAGITKNVRLHDARHTAVDLLYAAGVPEDLIMEIVGHSTRTMTQAYKSRGNMDRLRGAMELFSEQFTQLDGARPETRELGA